MMAGEGRPGPEPSVKHGTRSCYQYGCRRDECRAANAEYIKRTRREGRLAYRRNLVGIDDLAVLCWCEETIVFVPREVVLGGRTETCGREGCEEAA